MLYLLFYSKKESRPAIGTSEVLCFCSSLNILFVPTGAIDNCLACPFLHILYFTLIDIQTVKFENLA